MPDLFGHAVNIHWNCRNGTRPASSRSTHWRNYSERREKSRWLNAVVLQRRYNLTGLQSGKQRYPRKWLECEWQSLCAILVQRNSRFVSYKHRDECGIQLFSTKKRQSGRCHQWIQHIGAGSSSSFRKRK